MNPTLRERKHALARLALLDAFVSRLNGRPAEDIPVRELCDAALVSEATFFNHFGSKSALLVYFVQLWSIEVGWHAREVARAAGPLAALADLYARTARQVAEQPAVMAEVLAGQARLDRKPETITITPAERRMRFPDLPDLDSLPAQGLDAILPGLVREAIARGELPAETDVDLLVITLAALFFGTPMVLRRMDPGLVGPVWQAQLAALLAHPPRRKAP